MTVYVDNMRAKYGRMLMCHMIADSTDELHAMAQRIGIARRWYQGDHYDICLSKREIAVKNGAVEVTLRELSAMHMHRRATGSLGTPEEARKQLRKPSETSPQPKERT